MTNPTNQPQPKEITIQFFQPPGGQWTEDNQGQEPELVEEITYQLPPLPPPDGTPQPPRGGLARKGESRPNTHKQASGSKSII